MVSFGTFIIVVLFVHVAGIFVGYNIGIFKGIDISLKTALKEVINKLRDEFSKKGLGTEYDQIINEIFDVEKINKEE